MATGRIAGSVLLYHLGGHDDGFMAPMNLHLLLTLTRWPRLNPQVLVMNNVRLDSGFS